MAKIIARKPRAVKATPLVADASPRKPRAVKATPLVADASPATMPVPTGGYVLLHTGPAPALRGSRALRWPLLVQHANAPGGIASLGVALADGKYKASAMGMLRQWAVKAGYVRLA